MASVASLLAAVACFAGTHGSTQLVTVSAPPHATTGSLSVWTRQGACWRRVAGPWTAHLGRTGITTHKREGDGATPAGTYRLGTTVYGIAPDPGLRLRYHRLVCGDWWDEDPGSTSYNRFRHVRCGTAPAFGGDSEALWRVSPQYRYFAVVDYNAGPVVPGRGSAIFLHVAVGATAGCVSLPEPRLLQVLRWLRPAARPLIHIGIA
ncbi:MAG TPA: L,D-transpeptidase family protein [Gaiellaceae bacterium]|nr:L,D-transpeptidase family protein [Gaiellaceae bacterium]